jgi:hypothetical protein
MNSKPSANLISTICSDCGDPLDLQGGAWRKRRNKLPTAICHECERANLEAALPHNAEVIARALEVEGAKYEIGSSRHRAHFGIAQKIRRTYREPQK